MRPNKFPCPRISLRISPTELICGLRELRHEANDNACCVPSPLMPRNTMCSFPSLSSSPSDIQEAIELPYLSRLGYVLSGLYEQCTWKNICGPLEHIHPRYFYLQQKFLSLWSWTYDMIVTLCPAYLAHCYLATVCIAYPVQRHLELVRNCKPSSVYL